MLRAKTVAPFALTVVVCLSWRFLKYVLLPVVRHQLLKVRKPGMQI